MKRPLQLMFGAWALFATPGADAAQTTVTISMQAPPAAPRIGGARVIGVHPNTPLVAAIAATGTRPMTFSVVGLPPGTVVNSSNGQLSGTPTEAGTYTAMLTATNDAGTDTRALRIVVGDTLALTPPMGWNSYDSFDDSVRDSELFHHAEVMSQTVQRYGWDTLVIGFRWYDGQAPTSDQMARITNVTMDAYGRPEPFRGRFTGFDFKDLGRLAHSSGLKFGIHVLRGITRQAVQQNLPIEGSTYTAIEAADESSFCPWNNDMWGVKPGPAGQAWYDSLFRQYALWGVDFVKVDDAVDSRAPFEYRQAEIEMIRKAIDASGRSIVLSLSPGETPTSAAADLRAKANMWRISGDVWDRWSSLGDAANGSSSFGLAERWSLTNTGGPGHWPDADMLPLGHLGPRCPVDGADRNTRLTPNEQVAMMSLWAVMPSPLILGANLMATNDPFFTALVSNEEVIAVDQDELGAKGRMVVRSGNTEVWSKDLSGGRKAVALFNRGNDDDTVTVSFGQLGIAGARSVRDLWMRSDLTPATDGMSALVPWHSAALFVVVPTAAPVDAGSDGGGADAAAGAGGSAGAGGDAGTGGSTGGAGMTGGGGSGGGAGSSGGATGGTSATGGAGGAIGTAGSGGNAGRGGNGGSGGTAGSGPGDAAGDSGCNGCSCAVGAGPGATTGWLLAAVAGCLAVRRRRRRG